mmetsp:Transcript_28696/g.44962  ORF Transcript_28696/g.44962 Transcript_28696/m.44962 type:complete len:270 (+) Transcript_28696:75-884(+)
MIDIATTNSFVLKRIRIKNHQKEFFLWTEIPEKKTIENQISLCFPGYPFKDGLVLNMEVDNFGVDPNQSKERLPLLFIQKNENSLSQDSGKKLVLDFSNRLDVHEHLNMYERKIPLSDLGISALNPYLLYDFEQYAKEFYILHKKKRGLKYKKEKENSNSRGGDIFVQKKKIQKTSFYQVSRHFLAVALLFLCTKFLDLSKLGNDIRTSVFLFNLFFSVAFVKLFLHFSSILKKKIATFNPQKSSKTNVFYLTKVLIIGIIRSSNLFAN